MQLNYTYIPSSAHSLPSKLCPKNPFHRGAARLVSGISLVKKAGTKASVIHEELGISSVPQQVLAVCMATPVLI